ncbi:MAG: MBL fold metallo-hydrolase [Acidobacteria bacterium]|nr:MBL fold metallo-hydrolase [Acidobacteriota bacterium]
MRTLTALFTLLLAALPAASQELKIYWIDVEGGAATLIVTPEGETVLMDAGWPGFDGRDPKRIANVLEYEVGKKKIDYFIVSHFHTDHVGGLPELAKMVPIEHYVDHGDSVEKNDERGKVLWDQYVKLADGKRMTVKPGDKLPLQKADLLFVAAHSKFLAKPLVKVKPNPLCADSKPKALDETENGKSTGFLLRSGKFEFLDLGDLSWNFEHELACPVNLLGQIDLYQVTHHGMDMSGAPEHINAIQPRVAVMNNGHRKGGRPETYQTLTHSARLEDLWQMHKALVPDGAPNTDEKMIANLQATDDGDQGNWIKAVVDKNGSFTVTNGRNGYSKTYKSQ